MPEGILFDMRRYGADGPDEIYLLNSATLEVTQLTQTPEPFGSGYPRWSPDRSQIAFISNQQRDEDIFVMDEEGSNLRRLVHLPGDDWGPSWTPDGNRIAFISGSSEGGTLHLVNADGTDLSPLGDWVGEVSGDLNWSSDGRRLLFTSGRDGAGDVYLLDLDARRVQRLTESPEPTSSANASWSPKEDYIVFASDREGLFDIFRMAVDGSNIQRLTRSPSGRIGSWSPVQSPDGTRIVFVSDRYGDAPDFRENIDLFIMDADGSNERRITSNPWMEAHPDW